MLIMKVNWKHMKRRTKHVKENNLVMYTEKKKLRNLVGILDLFFTALLVLWALERLYMAYSRFRE